MTSTRPYLSGTQQRECRLYRIRGLDPRTHYQTITLIYIGETGRAPFTRFVEHLYEQPFGDTIVGQPEIDPRVFSSKAQVWAAEQAAIETERPLYNYEHNQRNPQRIPIPVAREQRWARDRAAGRALWQPGERTQQGGGVAPRRVPMSRSLRHGRPWTRRRIRAWARLAGWGAAAGLWFAIAGLVTVKVRTGAAAEGRPLSLGYAAVGGVVVATALYLLAWWARPTKRRRNGW